MVEAVGCSILTSVLGKHSIFELDPQLEVEQKLVKAAAKQ